ncbi:hypothetical protein SAMN05660909_05034 [Chitinophaga terrae (ex Kim and Jung 2007)]|uniref:Uncharacterized protein n=1 Tax=Chitinophaga terrae (ex Kim and Jung 2007) TaxID=408074 RepID=A0A1H4GAT0_9BACT|nr:hypothetical protein SAMN05660909_05034 [Chitinophaga terrae (ex Kim and Jung 2007)]
MSHLKIKIGTIYILKMIAIYNPLDLLFKQFTESCPFIGFPF